MTSLTLETIRDKAAALRRPAVDFLRILTGTVARLALQLAFFLMLTNTLTIADFGVFATITSLSLIASRATGFGLPFLVLHATLKDRLLGATLASNAFWFVVSTPILAGVAALAHPFLLGDRLPLQAFLLLVVADVLFWRTLEVVAVVNDGRRRFTASALWLAAGVVTKIVMAALLMLAPTHDLATFIPLYAAGNAAIATIAVFFGLPRLTYRFSLPLAIGQARKAIHIAGSNVVFFTQNELDKTLVFLIAGDNAAGLYAIAMRVVDLTAAPVRAFNQLMVQATIRNPALAASVGRRVAIELIVAATATLALAGVGFLLWLSPSFLGQNIAAASQLFTLLFAVAAARALIEYHSELLFALKNFSGQPVVSVVNAVVKLSLLGAALSHYGAVTAGALNMVFAFTYLGSMLLTHVVFSPPGARPVLPGGGGETNIDLNRFSVRFGHVLMRTVAFRPLVMPKGRPMVTFTFDDIPTSAHATGAAILERHGARGVFYVATGLMGRSTPDWTVAGPELIRDLARRGHEIGLHTHGHLLAADVSSRDYVEDIERNRQALQSIAPELRPENFAYPYGLGSFGAKQALGRVARSGRIVSPGINAGWIDLDALKAVELLEGRVGLDGVNALLDEAIEKGGWLIFLNHDVAEPKSQWGVSEAFFEKAVEAVVARGVDIVTLSEALDRIGAPKRSAA